MIEEIYKKLAEKHNVSEDVIKQVHLDFWKGVKKIVQEDTAKDILIGGFGTLYFDKRNLKVAQHELELRNQLNENFLKEGGDWMKYLYSYRSISYKRRQLDNLQLSIDKRNNRQKGERGL